MKARTAAAGLAAALLVVLAACGGGGADVEAGWKVLPASPLSGRFFPASAWTGSEWVLWGGGSCSGDFCNSAIARPLADGAAYDPAADSWRTIAASPLGPRLRPMSAWTGRELIVWGGNRETTALADGAAYDPAADRWRMLAPSPLSGRFGASAVWTGRQLLVWGGGLGGQSADTTFADGAAYDPAADAWRPLPASPLAARTVGVAAWTGTEMLIWGGSGPPDPDAGGASTPRADGAAYNPATGTWRTLAPSPLAPRGTTAQAWTGDELVIWGGGDPVQSFDDGAAYRPSTDTWRMLSPSPLQPRRATASAWTGSELVVWGGGPDNSLVFYGSGAAYDPGSDSWREIEAWNSRFAPASAWTGRELMIWGGIYAPQKIEVLADGARLTLG